MIELNPIELASRVNVAFYTALKSPCQSKRGVVIYSQYGGYLVSAGLNHQPAPFKCDGSDQCKRTCGRTAIHAEQSAIMAAGLCSLNGCWMLHVKASPSGFPCASGAPSCLECSKLILKSGIAWMCLLHDPDAPMLPGAQVIGGVHGCLSSGMPGDLQVRRYSAECFHQLTAEHHQIFDLKR